MGVPGPDGAATPAADLQPRRRGTWPRRRKRALAAGAVALAAALVAAVLLSSSGPSRAGAATGVPRGQTTTTVQRRTLTESTTADGTLGYAGSTEIYDRLATAGTFTWLPAAGAVVGRGGTLYRINDRPVALMYGSVPAYRTLAGGVVDGPDVQELNANLAALGYAPRSLASSSHFGEATAAAVRDWQHAEGLPETGKVELGRVVFAPGEQRVTKLHVALGQDPPGSPAAEAAAAEAEHPGETPPTATTPTATPPTATTPTATTPTATTPTQEAPAARKPDAKKPAARKPAAKPRSEPAAATSPSASSGKGENGKSKSPSGNGESSGAGAGTLVMGTTSTEQVVQLALKADDQQLARVGESTPVTLPDGSIVHGHVSSVGTVASESSEGEGGGNGKGNSGGNGGSGNGESATIPVTVALDHRVARLDKAPVSVELVKAVRRHVLAVPATALTATAGGGYAIAALQEGRRVEVPVTPGMFADGYVEIEGDGVQEGLTVLVSQ